MKNHQGGKAIGRTFPLARSDNPPALQSRLPGRRVLATILVFLVAYAMALSILPV